MNRDKTCKELVRPAFESRMSDIRAIVQGKKKDKYGDDLPPLNEYGLSIDFVYAHTFKDEKEGYMRYQLSWGGPSEEFRVYRNRVEFWYLDWYDGAHLVLNEKDANLIKGIVERATI